MSSRTKTGIFAGGSTRMRKPATPKMALTNALLEKFADQDRMRDLRIDNANLNIALQQMCRRLAEEERRHRDTARALAELEQRVPSETRVTRNMRAASLVDEGDAEDKTVVDVHEWDGLTPTKEMP